MVGVSYMFAQTGQGLSSLRPKVFCGQLECRIVELSVKSDHLHFLVRVSAKISISRLMGVVKGRTALRLFTKYPYLRKKAYWGNHF